MNFPEDLKYSQEHEWIRINGKEALIGITDFAQKELGDIVYVEVETVDEELEKDTVFGTIEAVKTVSDLFLPVSGKILEFNTELEGTPETINSDPYEKGWIVKIEINNEEQVSELLDATAYQEFINNA